MPFIGCKESQDDDSTKEIYSEGNLCPDVLQSHSEWEKSVPFSSDSMGGVEKTTTFRKIYHKMISTTEHAVRIQIELDAARAELARWKRTQSSRIYAHTSPSTRRLLDTQRKTYAQTVFNLEKQLTRALNDLSELSCRQFGAVVSGESDDNELEPYIDELSQWIKSLHHLIPQPCPSGTEDPTMWTWNQIEASVVVLNDLCGKFAELSLDQRHANIDSAKDDTMMRETTNVKRGKGIVNPFLHDERVKLRQQIAEEGEELLQLQTKLQHLENLHSQMQERLDTYTQWAEEDAAKIKKLSGDVELLYMLPNPAIQPPSDVLETTSEFVADESKAIAAEYFGKLVALCLQSHNNLLKDLDVRMLQPVRQLTQGIYEHAVDVEASDGGLR